MSGDYITRGATYLVGWSLTVTVLFAYIGHSLFGVFGMLGAMSVSHAIGLWGYNAYLNRQYNKRYGK